LSWQGALFAAGHSQAEVARTLGVARQNVSHWHAHWQAGGPETLRGAGLTRFSSLQWSHWFRTPTSNEAVTVVEIKCALRVGPLRRPAVRWT